MHNVRLGIGSDQRIGRAFLYPGPGYGGSCFPKDVKAIIHTADSLGLSLEVLKSVEAVNEEQKRVVLNKTLKYLGKDLSGKIVGVWGLAFKAETDDMRESPTIPLIEGLLAAGARVQTHDPKAHESAHEIFGDRVMYAADPYSAAHGADALLVMTEWLVYRNPDFERVRKLLRRPLLIDGRNLYDPSRMTALGFEYHGIGRGGGGRQVTRVLITGAAGFIGSHLVEALVRRGDEVIGIDNFDPFYPRSMKEAQSRRDGRTAGVRVPRAGHARRGAPAGAADAGDGDRPPRGQGRCSSIAGRPGRVCPRQRHRYRGGHRGGSSRRCHSFRVWFVLVGLWR